MPRGNTKEKRLARQRQAATGEPYTMALRHVREEHAARQAAAAGEVPAGGRVRTGREARPDAAEPFQGPALARQRGI